MLCSSHSFVSFISVFHPFLDILLFQSFNTFILQIISTIQPLPGCLPRKILKCPCFLWFMNSYVEHIGICRCDWDVGFQNPRLIWRLPSYRIVLVLFLFVFIVMYFRNDTCIYAFLCHVFNCFLFYLICTETKNFHNLY